MLQSQLRKHLLLYFQEIRRAIFAAGEVAVLLKENVMTEVKNSDSEVQQSNVVTVVDRLCQEVILAGIAKNFGHMSIYSEELKDLPEYIAKLFSNDSPFVFFLDPIDGTENYIKHGDQYSIMGGIIGREPGTIFFSFVFFPESKTLYWAVKGVGVFCEQGFLGSTSAFDKPINGAYTLPYVKRMSKTDFERINLHTDLRLVGDKTKGVDNAGGTLIDLLNGKHEVVIMRNFHGHDTAPVSLMLRELGGHVTGVDGEDVQFSSTMDRIPLVVLTYNQNLRRLFAI